MHDDSGRYVEEDYPVLSEGIFLSGTCNEKITEILNEETRFPAEIWNV
jgi:hypothetical protein